MNEEKNISRELVKGIFLLIIGASMLGGSGIFVKLSDSSPSLIAFYRSLFALPFLYAWMKFEERNSSSEIIWDKKTFFFLLLGGLCFALDMSIWNWSLSFTSVANATLMANIAPVFVVIFGVLFLGYKIEISFVVTLLLALLGVFLVILPGEQIMVFGDSLGILAAVFYAGYILSIKENVHFEGKKIEVEPTSQMDFEETYYQKEPYENEVPSYENVSKAKFGSLYGTRSGDKGGCANLGVWAKTQDAYSYLYEFLSVEKLKELLPDLKQYEIDRYELPNILSLNFYVHDILQDGVSSSTRLDGQAKSLGEYLRAKDIEIPDFLKN